MNYEKKISVIVPVYNSAKTLSKCIKSIISQTYKNIELLLVNDGSTDKSLEICKKFEKLDKRITVINKKNGGVSSARNIGIKNSTGEYLAFVDSDDYIEKDMLEVLLTKILDNNSDISICNLFIEDNLGNEKYNFHYKEITFDEKKYPFISYFNKSISGYVCNKLYSKNIIFCENEIINFNENISIAEDDLFNYELISKNKNIRYSYTDKKLYHYVLVQGSATNSNFKYSQLSYFESKQLEIKILNNQKISSDFLKIDYFINFVKISIKMKILGINYNSDYFDIKRISNQYREEIKVKNIPFKLKIKYYIARFFPIIYALKIKKDINKV